MLSGTMELEGGKPHMPRTSRIAFSLSLIAGEPKPSVQTILRAAIEQKSLRGFCEKLSKDNLREHLSRHEPIWREWDGV